MRGVASAGMLLAAESDDGERLELLSPPPGAPVGERLIVDGLDGGGAGGTRPDAVLKSDGQQKAVKRFIKSLRVNGAREATVDGVRLLASDAPCTVATLADVDLR